MTYINPADVGHWEGDDFVLNEPLITPNPDGGEPFVADRITISPLVFIGLDPDEGITRDDVISAFLNPIGQPSREGLSNLFGVDIQLPRRE